MVLRMPPTVAASNGWATTAPSSTAVPIWADQPPVAAANLTVGRTPIPARIRAVVAMAMAAGMAVAAAEAAAATDPFRLQQYLRDHLPKLIDIGFNKAQRCIKPACGCIVRFVADGNS